MSTIFECVLARGFLRLQDIDNHLYVTSGFRKDAMGVVLEVPAPEAADLTEALLRHLDDKTRLSVVSSVLGGGYASRMETSNPINDEVGDKATSTEFTAT